MILVQSHRLGFSPSPTTLLPQLSRVYITNQFSYIIATRSGDVDLIEIPHGGGHTGFTTHNPSIRRFQIEIIKTRSKSVELGLLVRVRTDFSLDCTTFDFLNRGTEISRTCVGPFPGVQFLSIVACDEMSGRLILCRGRGDYVLLDV